MQRYAMEEAIFQHRHNLTRFFLGGMAILLVVLAILGAGIVWWIISKGPSTTSPEVRFARRMATHHEQAVTMALIMYQRSTDENIRPLALDIILTQQNQIGQMQGWLASWNQSIAGDPTDHQQMTMMPGMANQQQINALQTLQLAKAEVSFLRLMIGHHQGGVVMAQEVLRQTQRPEVAGLATAIVQCQQSEIQAMRDLLQQRGIDLSR